MKDHDPLILSVTSYKTKSLHKYIHSNVCRISTLLYNNSLTDNQTNEQQSRIKYNSHRNFKQSWSFITFWNQFTKFTYIFGWSSELIVNGNVWNVCVLKLHGTIFEVNVNFDQSHHFKLRADTNRFNDYVF